MAKYCTYIILLFSLFSCKKQEGISDTQGKTFVKYFGSFGFDKSTNMQQTDDEGFIIAGTISSLTNGKEAAIIKTDKYGNEQWTKIYGDSLDNFANNILSIDDGYLVLGTTTDSLLTTNMWLFKINSSGNVIWSKQYGSESNEQGISLVKSNVDGYILAGTKSNITTAGEETDFYFLKIDNQGTVIWEDAWGFSLNDQCGQIIAYEHGYAVVGTTGDILSGNSDLYVLALTEDGTVFESKDWENNGNTSGASIVRTNDGFLVTGTLNSTGKNQIFCSSLSENFQNKNWEKFYGTTSNHSANYILKTDAENFLICGASEKNQGNGSDQFIMNISSNGDTLWTNTFGHIDQDQASYAMELTDGSYAVLGSTSFDNNQMISLIKTNENGRINE